MRALLVAALLAHPAYAALDDASLKQRFITNEDQSTRLIESDFPLERRGAFESVQSVQLGCEQPCASEAERALYDQKIRLASDALRLTGSQKEEAVRNYIRDGVPRLRSVVARKDTPAFNLAAASRLDPRLQTQLPQTMTRMTAALGGLLGPGDLDGRGDVNAGGLGTLSATDRMRELTRPGHQLPAALAMAGVAPPPVARERPQRITDAMYQEMRVHFDDPDMQRGLRHVLVEAERMVRGGRFDGGGGPAGAMYEYTNDRGKILLAAKDYMMGFRAGYGSSSAGSSDGGFEQASGVRLTAAQIADLDHFFFAGSFGAIPLLGTTLMAGGVLVWDGIKPVVTCNPLRSACRENVGYNWKQVVVGMRGTAYGTRVVSSALGR
jgi:hypothetical protein